MITLDTKDFTNLLHDLYSIYAPEKMDGIDVLIAKYDGEYLSQRNAIQMAYIIYNKPNHPNYNLESGTETYITKLMEKYARGERIISQETLDEQKLLAIQVAEQQAKKEEERKKKEEAEKQKALEEIRDQTQEELKKLQELENIKKEISKQKDYLQKESQALKENIATIGDLFAEIILECDVPVEFPGGNDYLITLCIGQRLIYQNPETQEIIGLEVEDINDDIFSSEDKRPIRIMKIKKV